MDTKQVFDKHVPQQKFLTLVVNSAIGILALLMFIAGMYPSTLNWGVNHLAFYPSTVRFIVPLLILLLLIPSVRQFLIRQLERLVAYFGKQKKPIRYLYAIIVLAASGVVFWIARTATHFLGDGYSCITWQREMGSKELFLNPWNREPLTIFLVFKLHKLFSALGSVNSAESAFRAYSIFCGIACIAILWKLTNFISKEHVERVLLFLFLLASGASQLFFGYVENYALAYTMVFLFITGIDFVSARDNLYHSSGYYFPSVGSDLFCDYYLSTGTSYACLGEYSKERNKSDCSCISWRSSSRRRSYVDVGLYS